MAIADWLLLYEFSVLWTSCSILDAYFHLDLSIWYGLKNPSLLISSYDNFCTSTFYSSYELKCSLISFEFLLDSNSSAAEVKLWAANKSGSDSTLSWGGLLLLSFVESEAQPSLNDENIEICVELLRLRFNKSLSV